jgi:TolB protein
VVLPSIFLTDDSVRVIVERDFAFDDRLDVVVLDAESRVALAQSETGVDESAQFGARYVLRLAPTETGVRASLHDVEDGSVLRASNFVMRWDSLGVVRMDVHRMSDIIESWIFGARGSAASRIAYVLDDKIHIIDSDGVGDTVVTTTGVALSPAWHPRGNAIVYSDLADAGTQIARLDLTTGAIRTFSATKRGFNITPVFTPRGDSVVYATAGVRGSRLVIASASGKGKARQLAMQFTMGTNDVAAPIFHPDGKHLAFVASRPSYPQIYTMDLNGSNMKRLVPRSTLRNERTAPEWSPDGTSIIYQQQNRKFQIWVAHVQDGVADTTTRVTSQGENEDPSWAPDGRHIVLTSTRGGEKQLWILDLDSRRWRQLTATPGARLASWSPRLMRE